MNNHGPEAVPTQLTEAKGTSFAREVFTSNFWMSGLAMLKYIPGSFRVKQVDGMAFFTESKHDEFRNRVLRITPANPAPMGNDERLADVAPCQFGMRQCAGFLQASR